MSRSRSGQRPPSGFAVSNALLDLQRLADQLRVAWAVVGGQALISYGVPRETLDADAFVPRANLQEMSDKLVERFGWIPLEYSKKTNGYVKARRPKIHVMDDPVLLDIDEPKRVRAFRTKPVFGFLGVSGAKPLTLTEERVMVPLRTQLGLDVELLAAQHPVEREMIKLATLRTLADVQVPVAPLGGVLLVKTKADRPKDIAALEQTAEHLSIEDVQKAIRWARKRDPATADDMQSILMYARTRRAPRRTYRED